MKEDVSVRVCGVQRCPGAEEDVSELVCEGVFKHTADGWLLAYEEPSEAGTVKTLLRFADSLVDEHVPDAHPRGIPLDEGTGDKAGPVDGAVGVGDRA